LDSLKFKLQTNFTKTKKEAHNKPYPSSFNKTPAKIMEPETSAFSSVSGNHELTKNTSIFAKNPESPVTLLDPQSRPDQRN
jgi:hypothetical protein